MCERMSVCGLVIVQKILREAANNELIVKFKAGDKVEMKSE